ncbi:MAG: hypothetical protein JWO12_2565 [Frankiales bacterium]|nr:hypothetical protein [Frankiales bacterium]
MHYGRVTKACIFVIAPGPVLSRTMPFRERGRTFSMCLSRLIARGCSGSYCTDRRRGDKSARLAAFRDSRVRLLPLRVKGFHDLDHFKLERRPITQATTTRPTTTDAPA